MCLRRYFALLLIGILVISMSGCKGNTTQKETEEETTTVKEDLTEDDTDKSNPHRNAVASGCKYYVAAEGVTLTEGDEMPDTPQYGDKYETQDYIYEYGNTYIAPDDTSTVLQRPEGWNPIVKDQKQASYEELLSSIAGKEVKSLYMTFYLCKEMTSAPKIPDTITDMTKTFLLCEKLINAPEIPFGVEKMLSTFQHCLSLKVAPEIPSSVTNMHSAFQGCLELTTAPVIPAGVTEMSGTFAFCEKLTGEVVINANPTDYEACFCSLDFEEQNLSLKGSSSMLEELQGTASNF